MTSRWYKKQQTRQAMIDAACAEISQGRSFDSLSLREVTRAAGIAPTTFYRHFQDMEEFGQALVESADEVVRADAQLIRSSLLADSDSVRSAIGTLVSAMQEHPAIYRLLLDIRLGPHATLRAASRRVLNGLTTVMADGLHDLALQRRRPIAEPDHAAEAITSLIWGRAGDIMAPLHQRAETITAELYTGVKFILLGAEQPAVDTQTREIA